jgi:hypothetical protein
MENKVGHGRVYFTLAKPGFFNLRICCKFANPDQNRARKEFLEILVVLSTAFKSA